MYKDQWIPVTNEELVCRREPKNIHDQYTVSVTKNDNLVGHVPRKINTMCSLFLRKEGRLHVALQDQDNIPQI